MDASRTLFLSVVFRIICVTLPSHSTDQWLHWKLYLLIDISFQCYGYWWEKDPSSVIHVLFRWEAIDGVVHCHKNICSLVQNVQQLGVLNVQQLDVLNVRQLGVLNVFNYRHLLLNVSNLFLQIRCSMRERWLGAYFPLF